MQWLMRKCVQNGSCNGGPDAALEGALDGELNVALEGNIRKGTSGSAHRCLKMHVDA